MNDAFLSTAYESLGQILSDLRDHAEVKESQVLSEHIQTALLFHHEIDKQLREVLDQKRELAKELYEFQKLPHEIRSAEDFSLIGKYRQIRDAGGDAVLIYKVAFSDGVTDEFMHARILKSLFDRSYDDTKALIRRVNHDK